jgi:hypothetical protein
LKLRFNFVILLGLVGLAVVLLLVFMDEAGPERAAHDFMQALAKKDIDKLTELTYLEERTAEEIRPQWDFALNKAAKHFMFLYGIDGVQKLGDDRAVAKITLIEFRGPAASEIEPVEVAMIKHEGMWKVDLTSTSRRFFPALPK